MIRILLAVLAALVVGGTLSVLWSGNRRLFWPALAATILVVGALVAYVVWMPAHGRGNLSANEVKLEAISLDPVAGSFRLRARLQNLSRDQIIVRIPVRLVIESCDPPGGTSCTVRGDRTQQVRVTVEPGQSREFFQVFPLDSRIPPDQLRWHVTVDAADSRDAVDER